VFSGRGLCDELITRPEESHRLWRIVVCDQETSWYEDAVARDGYRASETNNSNVKYGAETRVNSKTVFTFFYGILFYGDILNKPMMQKLDIYCYWTP
jgi:hypothetical protein